MAQPWDTLLGGVMMDLLKDEHREIANRQEEESAVTHFSPSCKTCTRIREIPIKGVKVQPIPVRSEMHPLGLPFLKKPAWAAMAKRVEDDNSLANWAIERCERRLVAGLGFTLEHPGNSYLFMFPSGLRLLKAKGSFNVLFHNCMFKDGKKRKLSRFVTNMPQVAVRIARTCLNTNNICSRTGMPHDSWKPVVMDGRVIEYKSEMEAEFQVELCEQLALGVAEFEASLPARMKYDFTEYFAGPRAPFTQAVQKVEFLERWPTSSSPALTLKAQAPQVTSDQFVTGPRDRPPGGRSRGLVTNWSSPAT